MGLEKIIYVADPMCSWCWGFSPIITTMRTSLPETVEFSVIMGGLRRSHPWDIAFRHFLRQSWQQVHRSTSQPFSFDLLEWKDFDYDTEPACRAVVAWRHIDPKFVMNALNRLQQAFYVENIDITDEQNILKLFKEEADTKDFARYFQSDEAKVMTARDAAQAKLYGATSFPSLVLLDDQGHLSVIKGYRDEGQLRKFLLV